MCLHWDWAMDAFHKALQQNAIEYTMCPKPFDIPGVFSDQNTLFLEQSNQCYGKELSINDFGFISSDYIRNAIYKL
jgi:hypothetical protein